jgi:hypothetical protein
MGPSRIVEPGDFPTSQDEPLNGPPIARTALKTIAKMDRAYIRPAQPSTPYRL